MSDKKNSVDAVESKPTKAVGKFLKRASQVKSFDIDNDWFLPAIRTAVKYKCGIFVTSTGRIFGMMDYSSQIIMNGGKRDENAEALYKYIATYRGRENKVVCIPNNFAYLGDHNVTALVPYASMDDETHFTVDPNGVLIGRIGQLRVNVTEIGLCDNMTDIDNIEKEFGFELGDKKAYSDVGVDDNVPDSSDLLKDMCSLAESNVRNLKKNPDMDFVANVSSIDLSSVKNEFPGGGNFDGRYIVSTNGTYALYVKEKDSCPSTFCIPGNLIETSKSDHFRSIERSKEVKTADGKNEKDITFEGFYMFDCPVSGYDVNTVIIRKSLSQYQVSDHKPLISIIPNAKKSDYVKKTDYVGFSMSAISECVDEIKKLGLIRINSYTKFTPILEITSSKLKFVVGNDEYYSKDGVFLDGKEYDPNVVKEIDRRKVMLDFRNIDFTIPFGGESLLVPKEIGPVTSSLSVKGKIVKAFILMPIRSK